MQPARAAQHDEINAATDPEGKRITAIPWVRRIVPGSAAAQPGVHCLRSTLVDQDNATLWRTGILLTELESVFRAPNPDLGLRPVLHHIDRRVEGHRFISGLPHHFVHTLRPQLKAHGIHDRRNTLHQTPTTPAACHRHLAAPRWSRRVVHVRKATRPKSRRHTLVTLLKHAPNAGRTHRVLV